jgi:hypothetical protein
MTGFLRLFLFSLCAVALMAPQMAQAQTSSPVTCTSLPCSYTPQLGAPVTISGSHVQTSSMLFIDTTLTSGQTTGTLQLQLNALGDDLEISGIIARLGYNPYGLLTLGPISFSGTIPGFLSYTQGELPTYSIDDVAMLTAFMTSLNIEDFTGPAGGVAASGGGDGPPGSTCNGDEGEGDEKCYPLADTGRREFLGCNASLVVDGFSWLPLPLVAFWQENSPEVEKCCAEHDICYINGGCEEDRAKCDEALGECIWPEVSWTNMPWSWFGLWFIELGGEGAFNEDPIGCRCILRMPEANEETTLPVLTALNTSETGEPSEPSGSEPGTAPPDSDPQTSIEGAIPEFDYLIIKHSECCVDNECVEYQSCEAELLKLNTSGSGPRVEQVGSIPGECKKFEGTGPDPNPLPPGSSPPRPPIGPSDPNTWPWPPTS